MPALRFGSCRQIAQSLSLQPDRNARSLCPIWHYWRQRRGTCRLDHQAIWRPLARRNIRQSRVFALRRWWRHNGDICRCLGSFAMIRPSSSHRIPWTGGPEPATRLDPSIAADVKNIDGFFRHRKRLSEACQSGISRFQGCFPRYFAVRFHWPLQIDEAQTVFAFIADSNVPGHLLGPTATFSLHPANPQQAGNIATGNVQIS